MSNGAICCRHAGMLLAIYDSVFTDPPNAGHTIRRDEWNGWLEEKVPVDVTDWKIHRLVRVKLFS